MKAISPVIAIILLVMISVAASVFLWVWLSGYVTGASSEVETGTETVKAAIKIDGIQYNPTQKRVYIYVTNIGDVPVDITAAYILDENGNVKASNTAVTLSLDPGKTGTVQISNTQLDPGTYIAKVVTTEGVEATYTFVVEGEGGEGKQAIEIYNVEYSEKDKKVTIWVKNTGETTVTIDKALVLDENGNIKGERKDINLQIRPGEAKDVWVFDTQLDPGTYIAKVVTTEGVEATYTFVVE